MMVNGKAMSVMDSELISIPMVTNMKVTGIMMFRKLWGPITTQMETSTKESGKMENQMVKETIFTKAEKPFTRATGKTAKKKALGNSSLKTTTAIQGNGKITKRKEKVATFIPMVKNMTANGPKTKSQAMELINTKMETSTLVDGKTIEGRERVR